jgi:hypothetical protein
MVPVVQNDFGLPGIAVAAVGPDGTVGAVGKRILGDPEGDEKGVGVGMTLGSNCTVGIGAGFNLLGSAAGGRVGVGVEASLMMVMEVQGIFKVVEQLPPFTKHTPLVGVVAYVVLELSWSDSTFPFSGFGIPQFEDILVKCEYI